MTSQCKSTMKKLRVSMSNPLVIVRLCQVFATIVFEEHLLPMYHNTNKCDSFSLSLSLCYFLSFFH